MGRKGLNKHALCKKSEENRMRYTKQQSFGVSLLRTKENGYYKKLNEKTVINDKLFWSTTNSNNLSYLIKFLAKTIFI